MAILVAWHMIINKTKCQEFINKWNETFSLSYKSNNSVIVGIIQIQKKLFKVFKFSITSAWNWMKKIQSPGMVKMGKKNKTADEPRK